jgi:hypothetical protein
VSAGHITTVTLKVRGPTDRYDRSIVTCTCGWTTYVEHDYGGAYFRAVKAGEAHVAAATAPDPNQTKLF